MARTRSALPELDLESVARLCVRHPGSTAPDLLARAATRGGQDARSLRELARSVGADPDVPLAGHRLDPVALGWFALVTAAFAGRSSTLDDVRDQLLLAQRAARGRALLPRFGDLWLDVLLLSGRADELPCPLEPSPPGGAAWRVRADQLNPFLGAGTERTEEWLTVLSEVFARDGLAPVGLAPGQGPPLHRLTCPVGPGAADDSPLVTVVMPVFRPGEDLRAALASVLTQSWDRLEVLLVDDGSGPESHDLLAELAASDPRVRLLELATNQGAYAARNRGLSAARGELVTFHDADDWAHPERVRAQVEPLLADPGLVATTSRLVRVDKRLAVTVLGYPAESVNASSLLFRRRPVLDRLGGFDTVRRAGDNEFIGRLRAVFGPRSVRALPHVLSLVQRTPGSLSREDLRLLFRDPAREHYRFCYRQWHGLVAASREDALVEPPTRPPVPARPRVLGGPPLPDQGADVLVLGGFSPGAPTTPDLSAEVVALRAVTVQGRGRGAPRQASVALAQMPSPVDLTVPARRPVDDVVHQIRTGTVGWVLPDEHVHATLAVVRDPGSVALLPDVLTGVTATAVLLVAGERPARRYDPAKVSCAVRTTCGAQSVRWLPATQEIARTLVDRVPEDHVLAPRVWGALPAPRPQSWDRTPRPLVALLPPSARLRAATLRSWAAGSVPHDPETTLVCRTGGPRLGGRLGRPVRSLRGTGTTQEEFLDQMSYLVAPPVPGRDAHVSPEVVHGLLRGCVAVLDPSYREHLGTAALYTDERTIDEWLTLHALRPELYVEQQERAGAFLTSELSVEALTRTVTDVLALENVRSLPGWLSGWRRLGARVTG